MQHPKRVASGKADGGGRKIVGRRESGPGVSPVVRENPDMGKRSGPPWATDDPETRPRERLTSEKIW